MQVCESSFTHLHLISINHLSFLVFSVSSFSICSFKYIHLPRLAWDPPVSLFFPASLSNTCFTLQTPTFSLPTFTLWPDFHSYHLKKQQCWQLPISNSWYQWLPFWKSCLLSLRSHYLQLSCDLSNGSIPKTLYSSEAVTLSLHIVSLLELWLMASSIKSVW